MKIQGFLKSATTAPSPDIECYLPVKNPLGIGIVIFPGGGYGMLAPHEGKDYANYLSEAGFASFVVTYRLGRDDFRHPAMLEDALSAVNTVRSRAKEFGIDPNKIGVMGSSAGGHLAAHTMTSHHLYSADVSLRPDFGVLCYPVILSTGDFVNRGSFRNLAGPDASTELLDSLSCEKLVSADTPPCFMWHTVEDVGVPPENSMAFASSLRKHGIRFELLIYEKGRHGLGLVTDFDWASECVRWIKDIMA